MKYFDGIIVVEGKNDACFLSSFIDSEYVVLNGYELNKDTINYLTHISKKRKILLMADPDKAGKEIRENFLKLNINVETIIVDFNCCNKHGKHGVAECEKKEIENKLKKYIFDTKPDRGSITVSNLATLGVKKDKDFENYIKYILNKQHLLFFHFLLQ